MAAYYKDSALKFRRALETGGSGVDLLELSAQDIKGKSRSLVSRQNVQDMDLRVSEGDSMLESSMFRRLTDAYERQQNAESTRERFLAMLGNQENGKQEEVDLSPSAEAPERKEATGKLPSSADKLLQDDAFMNQLALMQDKYPALSQQELFDVIKGESNFKPDIVNSAGYKGLFQIGKEAAKDAGIDYANLEKMSPADQLKAYEKYLDFWGYDGSYSLGILQAAPSKRNASSGTIVYKAGSKEALANPGWLDANGNATVDSINKYYGYK